MVAVPQVAAQPSAGRVPAFTPIGLGLAIVIVVVIALVGIQLAITTWPPVSAAASAAVIGDVQPCNDAEVDEDGASDCYVAPFAEGQDIGLGVTLHNDAPIPMTIVAADAMREGVLAPAELAPFVSSAEGLFSLGEDAEVQSVEVPAGADQAMQFTGTFGDCRTVARDWVPGSGLVLRPIHLTLRWLFFETETVVEAPISLALEAPTSCP